MNTQEVKLQSYTSRIDPLLKSCADKSVLHPGCSSRRFIKARVERGSLLHMKIHDVAKRLAGIDLDRESLVVMEEMLGYGDLYEGNAEHLNEIDLDDKFDVVLAGDLFEHITRPGAILEGISASSIITAGCLFQ